MSEPFARPPVDCRAAELAARVVDRHGSDPRAERVDVGAATQTFPCPRAGLVNRVAGEVEVARDEADAGDEPLIVAAVELVEGLFAPVGCGVHGAVTRSETIRLLPRRQKGELDRVVKWPLQ